MTSRNEDVIHSYLEFEDHMLVCPVCGGLNLHHELVSVYSRNEDDATARLTTVNHDHTTVGASVDTGPGDRRGGLVIEFSCETCLEKAPRFELCVYQHKGSTYTEWAPLRTGYASSLSNPHGPK